MIHFPEKTAISRNKPSKPMSVLFQKNCLNGKMLDYGCGKGKDADFFNMEKYDPFYFPNDLKNSYYDTITCQYVLNVLPLNQEKQILNHLKNLLNPKGTAYITVRRDIIKEGLTNKKTYQRNVFLDLPIFYEQKSNFCIYVMKNDYFG